LREIEKKIEGDWRKDWRRFSFVMLTAGSICTGKALRIHAEERLREIEKKIERNWRKD